MRKVVIYLRRKINSTDYILLSAVCLLSVYGLLVIAGTVGTSSAEFLTQLFGYILGVPAMFVLMLTNWQKLFYDTAVSINGRKYRIFPALTFAVYTALLIYTLVFGVGDGNQSWLPLPFYPYHYQPSELIKPLFMLTFSAHIDYLKRRYGEHFDTPLSMLWLCLHGGSTVLLVAAQGDLGSALVFTFMFAVMLYCAGIRLRWFAIAGGVIAAAVPLLWSVLKEYQRMRIIYGFRPDLDPYGYGYQALQSRRVISLSGLFGNGYGNPQIENVPAVENDMILASLTSQFGYIGAVICAALMVVIVARIMRTGKRITESAQKNTAPSIICSGAAAVLIFQTVVSFGMSVGVLPVIGLTLPLVSCGGSSVLSTLIMLGLVLGLPSSTESGEQTFGNQHHDRNGDGREQS